MRVTFTVAPRFTPRAVLDILNEAIVHSTALYEYQLRTPENMLAWFARKKKAGGFPVIGMETAGTLLGFATYGTFRARAAYKYTVEHSVYVHKDHRGRGIGMALMRELIVLARQQQYHVLVGGIDITNTVSVHLHERLGFSHAGTIRQSAFKFGRWLDLGFYQLVLDTPVNPVEGLNHRKLRRQNHPTPQPDQWARVRREVCATASAVMDRMRRTVEDGVRT